MPNIVGQNNPCPCGSGKKFKDCCINRMDKISTIANQFSAKVIAEEYALNYLLNNSLEFANFYHNERYKINRHIFWAVNPSWDANISSMSFPDGEREFIIILKQVPLQLADAFDAAHELRHLICNEQGFPFIGLTALGMQDNRNNQLAGIVANTINDPLANAGLIKYNFDLWGYYDQACSAQRVLIEQGSFFPDQLDPLYKLAYISFYVQKQLDWELACTVNPRKNNDFLDWLAISSPNSTKKAKSLLEWIKLIGYGSPQQAFIVFTELIKKFNREDILTIV